MHKSLHNQFLELETHRTLYLVSTSQKVTDEILLRDKFSGDSRELETQLLVLDLMVLWNNYYARVIIIECKNKRFAANIIHLFVEARRAETNKWFITNERSELK